MRSADVAIINDVFVQPITVGGLTIASDDLQSLQILDSQTQKIRSVFFIFGLFMHVAEQPIAGGEPGLQELCHVCS